MLLILLIAGLGWVALVSLVLALCAAAAHRDRAQVRPKLRLVHSAAPDPQASDDDDSDLDPASEPRGAPTSALERSSADDSGSVRQAQT